jgi:hypothetical protein
MSSTSIARLIVVSSFHDHFWHLEKVRTPENLPRPYMCLWESDEYGRVSLLPPQVIRWSPYLSSSSPTHPIDTHRGRG